MSSTAHRADACCVTPKIPVGWGVDGRLAPLRSSHRAVIVSRRRGRSAVALRRE